LHPGPDTPDRPGADARIDPPIALDAPATGLAPAFPEADTGSSRLLWFVSLAIIALDQIAKALVRTRLPLYGSQPLIPGFLDLVHVQNAGVAFGLLNQHGPERGLLTKGLAVLALAGIAYYAMHLRRHERLARIGLSLILGGAVGNLMDRMRQGFVIDFVDVYWRGWHFWAFNVADAAITIGAVLVFVELLFVHRHASHSS
jgi:signal peptidase II